MLFTNPCGDSKIVRHMIAVTTVNTAHGTSTVVRSRPWPLKASCMHSAMPRPMTNSSETLHTLKIRVVFIASQKSGFDRASE